MPLTRRSVPLLVAAALLLGSAAAEAADPTLSPTPPPGLLQGKTPTPHKQPTPSRRHHVIKPAERSGGALPQTGTDLGLESAVAAALIAGGTLLRAPRYFGRR